MNKGKNTKNKEVKDKKEKRIPYHIKPVDMTVEEWQKGLRRQYAIEQEFRCENLGEHPVFSDFNITNPISGKTYKVAIRSEEPGLNYCSCPDFKVNTLGTCKHVEWLLHKLRQNKRNTKLFKAGYHPYYSSITLRYGKEKKIQLKIGETNHEEIKKIAKAYFDALL